MHACAVVAVFQEGGEVSLRLLAFSIALSLAIKMFTPKTNANKSASAS